MEFPITRMRRLRKSPQIRNILRETTLRKENFIYPMFVKEDLKKGQIEPIVTMPGENRFSLSSAVEEAKILEEKGLSSILLFGMPSKKDNYGTNAFDPEGIVQRAIKAIKETAITYTKTGNPKGIEGPLSDLSGFGWKFVKKNKPLLFGKDE